MARRSAVGAEWRREALRVNLWVVPAIEIDAAVLLFAGTYAVDRAICDGHHVLPSWMLSGSADGARLREDPPGRARDARRDDPAA